jgi:hypothetical protein
VKKTAKPSAAAVKKTPVKAAGTKKTKKVWVAIVALR